MPPVTATSAGIARQTIDDPNLIALLERLSEFDPAKNTTADGGGDGATEGGDGVVADKGEGDGDVAMADANNDSDDNAADDGGGDGFGVKNPPLDIAGLVAELERVPRWQFQEQADLYEWIHPLNAMDAALEYYLKTYPSLLLIPSQTPQKGTTDHPPSTMEVVESHLSTILTFLSHLLRNATNKSLFSSLSHLSSLLASSSDQLAALATEALSSLAMPPVLHRQQAPELSQHVTALHKSYKGSGGGGGGVDGEGDDDDGSGDVMGRLMSVAKGWGTKGSGLGLLRCVTLDDGEVALLEKDDVSNDNAGRAAGSAAGDEDVSGDNVDNVEADGNEGEEKKQTFQSIQQKRQQRTYLKCAGEISFECYIPPEDFAKFGAMAEKGCLLSLHVSKEEMFASSTMTTEGDGGEGEGDGVDGDGVDDDGGDGEEGQAEKKRRKIATQPSSTNSMATKSSKIKSTAQLYNHCLSHLSSQLPPTLPPYLLTKLLAPAKLFSLLSSIRLARSFHSSQTRVDMVQMRLRALIAIVHAHPVQESVGAYFVAQPELCGELVDLLRPSVSSGHVAGNGGGGGVLEEETGMGAEGNEKEGKEAAYSQGNSILALADSPLVPYTIRTLAIEALTALVARRDASGTLTSNVARQTNVLSELGVGKGQYLGLLPTLIRYSLAALNSFLLHDGRRMPVVSTAQSEAIAKVEAKRSSSGDGSGDADKDLGLELGLAFLKATKPPPLPRKEREERALEFIDSVLTLTSAVISVPSGTASLTDCGIIPALVSTIALDGQMARRSLQQSDSSNPTTDSPISSSPFCTNLGDDESYSDTLLKFISAQAIQILEGAIVTHNSALSAFHELKGVDILVQRLNVEVEKVKLTKPTEEGEGDDKNVMDTAKEGDDKIVDKKRPRRTLRAARRVLLFSAVNCLTVVFHQHDSSGSNPAAPSGGAQLRKPELCNVLLEILDNVDSYGGVLAALVATFLSDVMNGDPQVVHYVHKCGLAKSFLGLLKFDKSEESTTEGKKKVMMPKLEPSGELIMALPNVLMALSLTEAGAKAVLDANPFPALLSLFCSPQYVMPHSRCLLSEMGAIIGTGLDELMRHNPTLKTVCLKAVVGVMERLVELGKKLISDEDGTMADPSTTIKTPQQLEMERTHLVQYSYNMTQLLEQILHSDDHVTPFVAAGGFDALLDMAQWTVTPGGKPLVAHISCLSSVSVARATHSTTSTTLDGIVKSVCSNTTDPSKLIKKIMSNLRYQLSYNGSCIKAFTLNEESSNALSCAGLLSNVPPTQLYNLDDSSPENLQLLHNLSGLYRSLINVDWLTNSLATAIRAACQRANELGGGLSRDREWKKEICSEAFGNLVDRLSLLHRSSLYEVCRIRTQPTFDSLDSTRTHPPTHPLLYKIRIVCQEGAVVRDGIDIDRHDSVGSLEMGEIVHAYDRCINPSGVLRYRTERGWVSELTRGTSSRENITEVLDVRVAKGKVPNGVGSAMDLGDRRMKRVECGVPDLRSTTASILARLHGSQSNLFSSLEKIMVSGIRPPPRSLSLQTNSTSTVQPHVVAATKLLSTNLRMNFDYTDQVQSEDFPKAPWICNIKDDEMKEEKSEEEASFARDAAKCMYFGNQLNNLHSSLCEEKKEEHRRVFYVPLLINLLVADGWKGGLYAPAVDADVEKAAESQVNEEGVILTAIRFVLNHSLTDMAKFAAKERNASGEKEKDDDEKKESSDDDKPHNLQRMSKAVASSLPPTLSLLRRLISRPLLVESQITSILTKMKEADFEKLLTNLPKSDSDNDAASPKLMFNAPQFARALHLSLAKLSMSIWTDARLSSAPSHVVHPFIQFVGDVIRSLEEASRAVAPPRRPSASERDTERRTLLTGGSSLREALADPTSRSGRILASMGLMQGVAAAGLADGVGGGEESLEPFEPSEDSISRLAEMGFGRDHALEALESVGTNRVEVAMEYALSHPPSSPGTLERRRAAREQRRQELQRRREEATQRQSEAAQLLASAANAEQPNPPGEASNDADGAPDQPAEPADSDSSQNNENDNNKEEESKQPKPLSDEELRVKKGKEIEEKLAAEAKEYLEGTVKESLCRVSLDIIEGSVFAGSITEEMSDDTEKEEQADNEKGDSQSVIIVMSNFLLDICRAFPALESNLTSELIVKRLKAKLDVKSPAHCQVKTECESSFAALTHASVVIFRARPQLRPSVLRHGLVGMITHAISSTLQSGKNVASEKAQMVWPKWLPPALLILDVMAQPTPVMLEDEGGEDGGTSKPANKKSEYGKVIAEHKKQIKKQTATTTAIFAAVMNKDAGKTTPKKKKDPESKKDVESKKQGDRKPGDATSGEEGKPKPKAQQALLPPPIPSFLPLLHTETQEACMILCLRLLGLRSKKGVVDRALLENVCPPPAVVNAILILLVRVLRSRHLSSLCLQMGGADLILALPDRAHFSGNRDLVSLILRRMLEDEVTLLSMMEGEIRSTVSKIYKKQHPSHSAAVQPKVNLKSFMQACAPLMSRDPMVFLKAIAATVKIGSAGSESSSLSSSRGSQVSLLSNEERVRNAKVVSSHLAKSNTDVISSEKPASQEVQPRRSSRGRSKSPHRSALTKSPSKSTPLTKNNQKSHIDGTPANHITSLLLKEIMRDPDRAESDNKKPFLSTIAIIDTLSDLVLAVPACGAAIHRYKLPKGVIIHNAISGCSDPPQTAINYFLHKLLPQPRVAPKPESESSLTSDADKTLKTQALNKMKTAQAGARLIVCLVARSGEGRRRALTDLVFALSCGRHPQDAFDSVSTNSKSQNLPQRTESIDENAEMWAISAWAELCMGLSAPRSGAGTITDSNSTLSFGVIKTLLEAGVAHALMAAIERIRLHHPMASSVASSIIRPLEIFTRGSVYNTVVEMAEKEKAKLDAAKGKESRRVTFGPSLRREDSLYDAALEDEFVNNSSSRNDMPAVGSLEDESMEDSIEDDDVESMEEDSDDGSSELEVRLGNVDYSDESDDNGDSSDEEVSSDSSSDEEEVSDEESEDEDMDDEDDEADDVSVFSGGGEEAEEVGGWGADHDDFFDGNVEDEANNGGAAGGPEMDDGMMEGWTRIDNSGPRGLGGMLLDMVQPQTGGRSQNGGFLMDAAETMLGNILRGDLGVEGLSEIEDALGVRVVRGDGRGGSLGLSSGLTNRGPPGPAGNNSIGGGRPAVHQNTSVTTNRNLLELNPMECVFGAPATGGGTSAANENDRDYGRQSESLFPGGLAASTQPRSHPSIHPLLQSVRLPPINSLVSTPSSNGEGSGSLHERSARTIASSGSYIAGTNGNIIRVNDRFRSHEGGARRTTGVGSGWVDDGLPPDRSTEDFSVSFGQALDSFLQEQASQALSSQNQSVQNEHSSPDTDEGSAPPEDQAESSTQHEVDDAAAEESEMPTESVAADTSNNEQPPAEEQPSTEAAEVSSAMAAVRVSQPASDNAPTPPNPSILNDQGNTQSNPEDVAECADDVVMAEEPSVGADVEETAQAQEEEPQLDDQPADSHIPNHEGASNQEEAPQESATSNDEPANEEEEGVLQENATSNDEPANEEEEVPEENAASNDEPANEEEEAPEEHATSNDEPSNNDAVQETGQLTCPPDIDPEVFMSLPVEMQQEIVQQHEVEAQISESGLDPEALAALPEDMRREVIEQEQQQQRLREQEASQPAADPANAEEMDNASFLASLTPDLRNEILLTADEAFISSLPPTLIAEANVLRERVASQHRHATNPPSAGAGGRPGSGPGPSSRPAQPPDGHAGSRARRQRNGKLRIELDRKEIVYAPGKIEDLGPLLTAESAKAFLSLFYLLSPIQPRITHRCLLNMCLCENSRNFFLNALLDLLNNDRKHLLDLLKTLESNHTRDQSDLTFPPSVLIGTTDLVVENNPRHSIDMFRKRQGNSSSVTVAESLPASSRGSGSSHEGSIPPVVARRIVSLLNSLCKSSPRVAFTMLSKPGDGEESCSSRDPSCLEKLLDLLELDQYTQSASNLEQLLGLLEIVVAPLSLLPKDDQAEIDLAPDRASPGREWVKVPRQTVSKRRLHLLINTLRLESCKDSSFLKVNTLTRRLSRVETNRECILDELALVAEGLGKSAIQDLKAVSVRLSSAAKHHRENLQGNGSEPIQISGPSFDDDFVAGTPSSAVSLSTSNSELKLLRVLQMLNALCAQDDDTKNEGNIGTEFVSVLRSLKLEALWDQLSFCLKTVGVLEGVANVDVDENDEGEEEENSSDNNDDTANGKAGKKLQNSVAGLITRFLPAIEAFFMVNASAPSEGNETTSSADESPSNVDNSRVVQFAASNKILLNALLRSNPQLLEKGLRAMVKMPKCRVFLDFDNKRQWFRTQVRRLRQQASRRHGSFRLNLRRKHVFEDSFHAFVHRNADELRGRLHITFQNEEGVDAGGLSREFFAILAKEMFNPNYALFMSTEDGCTFQPNPNSNINPDDLRYFRFVGRIVGKAVVDGFLLDAHFTRSLYKHMLGVKPTHHDMQAIDPDYYKNLQMILEHNLEDIGLELTFSTEDHSFGRSRTIDLLPDGRKIHVTEETKAKYVDLVCQHRMTHSIEKQIKAYLEGFHEMVDPDLISIFTAKELELLISGMPDIDIHDLKKNTDYNGYRPADKEIGWFWNIMFALTRSEKAAFLQFVTGSSKVPLAGFSELQGMRGVQKFSINKASGPSGALMSAHTCFNALDLPVYNSEEEMKEKLLYAISEGSGGFGFA